ncbi:hypothetical protein EB796_012924 [Bugula neritina]|uniref:Uncharacterized protein n=1 Tax=Bugula neritina TaxID=10212 RepID=A0A7J7JSZ5_BUGNE|nr:hypothetical protein EB796_012924 [Bugula neritina]
MHSHSKNSNNNDIRRPHTHCHRNQHVKEPRQESVQNQLNDMDLSQYNSKPKIAVIQSSVTEQALNLIPPGPDYLIILVKYKIQSSHSSDPHVQKVSVNSTLNKRYIRDDDTSLVEGYENSEPGNNQ